MIQHFADAMAVTRPITLVRPAQLDATIAMQTPEVAAWLRQTGFAGALGEIQLIPGLQGVAGAMLGVGDSVAQKRTRFGLTRAISTLPSGNWHLDGDLPVDQIREIALGWLLAFYKFDRYRTAKPQKPQPLLKLPAGIDAHQIIAMAEGEFLTRDLINTPASDMGPAELGAAFHALAASFGAQSTQVCGDDLLAQGFPMIHAVGRASIHAPRLLELRWGSVGPKLTLVGKGVCFDTGGLNIKPSGGMLLMKKDMGGAATVMGLAQMIMQLKVPVQLRVIVGAVENVIAGNAMRPKDILKSRKGLTVEVNDTDAEGRLVLADALAYACEEDHDLLISMATLTGAARVAVGPDLAPFYCDSDLLAQQLEAAAKPNMDPVWRLPFVDAYEPIIEPGIADLDNAPGWGFAGSITAALFLRRFVSQPNYIHFDIYGHTPSDQPSRPKGGAGQGARALLGALPAMLDL